MTARIVVRVQSGDFDTAAESTALIDGLADVGAVVTFTGICRADNGRLDALELEHYAGMAEAEITRIAEDTARRWPVTALAAIHRVGKIAAGENIVLVIAVSSHRQATFEAASYLMDFLKSRAPFWKKEHERDGTAGAWIEAKESDEAALLKWGG